MTDSRTLLEEYTKTGSEAAFQELVERYVDLVYSTAIRLAGGDSGMAEDVAQTVFVDLARLAKTLSHEVRLGGWLHRHTCFVAAKTLRGERRRRNRERQAVEMNAISDHSEARLAEVAPILDDAINQLGGEDRATILLRFYERLDFRSVGEAMGTNEAAAQKRTARALEKLHTLLRRRGVTLSAAALGVALAGEAVTAAPATLAASISCAAIASAVEGTGSTLTLLRFMAATKLKSGIIAAVIAASVVTPLLVQRQAQARLRDQDGVLRQQTAQLAQVAADKQRLADLLSQPSNSPALSDSESRELLRLRGEVGRLRQNVREMASAKTLTPLSQEDQLAAMRKSYAAQVDRLKQWLEDHPSEKIPELQRLPEDNWLNAATHLENQDGFEMAALELRSNAENDVFGVLARALRQYARINSGQFPTDLAQLKPYFSSPLDGGILQRYQIVPAKSLVSELQPGGDWVITQAAPANPELDARQAWSMTQVTLDDGTVTNELQQRRADQNIANRWTLVH